MISILWVVFYLAVAGPHFGYGLPLQYSSVQYQPDPGHSSHWDDWTTFMYTAFPAVALVLTAVSLLLGCVCCYRNKDFKPNEGADNQLFSTSAIQLNNSRPPAEPVQLEPANNNISEANNNGPISFREMQNIVNNNAAEYITSENEQRNRVSRESVVQFEPLPSALDVGLGPLQRCSDWLIGDDLPRSHVQYVREIDRGWFGRVVEGEMEENGNRSTVFMKILNQNATPDEKVRFLDEARIFKDMRHDHLLPLLARCLQDEPWMLIFEMCSMDLQQYLITNRPQMASLNESGVPLRLMCDVTSALAYLHNSERLYGCAIWSGNVLVRDSAENARGVLGCYSDAQPPHDLQAPERSSPTASSEVWSLGSLIWEVCSWATAPVPPAPLPPLPCPYRNHLYQVMQLCWNNNPEARPTSSQVHGLLNHLYMTHINANEPSTDNGYNSNDFEDRWEKLKPNSIPKIDEHIAIVHAPSTSMASHFTGSDYESDKQITVQDSLSVDLDTAVSRSSSIMSDKEPLSSQIKSESLNNLHGSFEDVRNIYLTHNETAAIECNQANIPFDDKEYDRSDRSVDHWLKDIIAGSQDDVSYYKDVSDVIKNLDNILNSEKTSSSESSHQASPSRDNLSLDCKKDTPVQSSLVKSPGINNFQNILGVDCDSESDENIALEDDDVDRKTIGNLSHSFERHSDTISQNTLENLTPDTPFKEFDITCKFNTENSFYDVQRENSLHDKKESLEESLPKETVECKLSKIPMLRELCLSTMHRISKPNEQHKKIEDCLTSCDSNLIVRKEQKSEEESLEQISSLPSTDYKQADLSMESTKDLITSDVNSEDLSNKSTKNQAEGFDKQRSITEQITEPSILTNTLDEIPSDIVEINEILEFEENIDSNELMKNNCEELGSSVCSLANGTISNSLSPKESNSIINNSKTINDISKELRDKQINHIEPDIVKLSKEDSNLSKSNNNLIDSPSKTNLEDVEVSEENATIPPKQYPDEEVQTLLSISHEIIDSVNPENNNTKSLSPKIVQNIKENQTIAEIIKPHQVIESNLNEPIIITNTLRSDFNNLPAKDNIIYMDLINDTSSELFSNTSLDNNVKDIINTCLETTNLECNSCNENAFKIINNESTVYLDLPNVLKVTDEFLHSERVICSNNQNFEDNLIASTPKGSDISNESTLECLNMKETDWSDPKSPKFKNGIMLNKLEQNNVPENMSPFDSPSKSHHTDTYDENSSVVLGPFENCSLDLNKAAKSYIECIEIPKEEVLAFSSNFSDINLETPSPLRDVNFLKEVPDIIEDEMQFFELPSLSELKPLEQTYVQIDNSSDDTDGKSLNLKHTSPLTPPNSPGNFLASTSQHKYIVDIDLNQPEIIPHVEPDSGLCSLQKDVDLNQIELHMTTKLAMADNENNLNIEYSGPLTVEGLIQEDSDAIPESYLSGNGGFEESDSREGILLDEECVKALRNELELKLPLAQVASIEPACDDNEPELPDLPPAALVVTYSGALSPIAEETCYQLTAFENDTCNPHTQTESSESYPEPCNNSTDEVTDLPTGAQSGFNDNTTYTIKSNEHSANDTYTVQRDATSSKEITMSADSLNGSPLKVNEKKVSSPIDDRTYNRDDKESICEKISKVSPYLLSPTSDSSLPNDATGVSTLSKSTLPTENKHSKPSDTQCMSKATTIDSWCSNDTLYNVEENFDDLALDLEPADVIDEDNSDSTCTLTQNDEDKDLSHCSTYIVYDSKSEHCEAFSPDSISLNDNHTYTKAKAQLIGTSPSIITTDVDPFQNTQMKDTAYSTMPSYSNCSTELVSNNTETWNIPPPELVRRSPIGDEVNFSPPRLSELCKISQKDNPDISIPRINKMESVELTCLQDSFTDNEDKINNTKVAIPSEDSCNYHFRNIAPSITSTPLTDDVENLEVEPIEMTLPETNICSPVNELVPDFQHFQQSAEVRPQDLSSNVNSQLESQDVDVLLQSENNTFIKNSNITPTYTDFECSVETKPQEINSSQNSVSTGHTTEEFKQFENSISKCPQDLSSLVNASSLFLNSERLSSDMAFSINAENNTSSLYENQIGNTFTHETNPSSLKFLVQPDGRNEQMFITDLDEVDEHDQPHSIIMTESILQSSPNKTYDSHIGNKINSYESCNSHDIIPNIDSNSHESLRPILGLTYKNKGSSSLNSINSSTDFYQFEDSVRNRPQELSSSINPSILASNSYQLVNDLPSSNIDTEYSVNKNETQVKVNGFHGNVTNDNLSPDVQEIHANNLPQTISDDSLKLLNENYINEQKLKFNKPNGNGENFATVNFINESFEELLESNVDDSANSSRLIEDSIIGDSSSPLKHLTPVDSSETSDVQKVNNEIEKKVADLCLDTRIALATESFLQNEKTYSRPNNSYSPLLSDIRFTGPADEIMSTSFSEASPTDDIPPKIKTTSATDLLKEWESDSESDSSNSSSNEFIWKDGDGHETSVVPSTRFDHHGPTNGQGNNPVVDAAEQDDRASSVRGSDCESFGSSGSEVEFVPSSWDCLAEPTKSSLRTDRAQLDSKKRVVFKTQKYHCVYEYPREVTDVYSPHACLPDLSTYTEWDSASIEGAELSYGQLYGGDGLDMYSVRGGMFGGEYDDDFFISSSTRPFESLGVMSTSSQFFPGMHLKQNLLDTPQDAVAEEIIVPPSPLPITLPHTKIPSQDFTTPDSGVEDVTPVSAATDEECKKLPESETQCWRQIDSASSSESVSPSSPGSELGGLRHTRDKLKLDLPPSPHIPSPRHNKIFNFVLDKPKRQRSVEERPVDTAATPLVMSDETPLASTALPLEKAEESPVPEPTFSTFGKKVEKENDDQTEKNLTPINEVEENKIKANVETENVKSKETVKGEGTVLDSGDEDSGIESSSKATLERKTPNIS